MAGGDLDRTEIVVRPSFSVAQRDEIGKIEYFLEQVESLRSNGLLSDNAHAAVALQYGERRDAIQRAGEAKGAIEQAREWLKSFQYDRALRFAIRARTIEPDSLAAWEVESEALVRLGRFDDALERVREGVARFPEFAQRITAIESKKREAQVDLERKQALRESRSRDAEVKEANDRLRTAASAHRYEEAIAIGNHLLELRPNDLEALSATALAHEQLGHWAEAMELYRRLRVRYPDAGLWARKIADLWTKLEPGSKEASADLIEIEYDDLGVIEDRTEGLVGERIQTPKSLAFHEPVETSKPAAIADLPGISHAIATAEFFKDHWQKLILCLAVLLIVVSSTVGAHHLLGDQLVWSKVGQCVLTLVYTSLFAGFGLGLARWGAGRTGKIMLLTTLMVVPVNFSLVGQLRLVLNPTPGQIGVFLLVLAVLLPLCWLVSSIMQLNRTAVFPLAFFLLSAGNGIAARGVPYAWVYSALIIAGQLYLAAVWGVGWSVGTETEDSETAKEFVTFAFGLLTYAFLFASYRAGVYVLQFIPKSPPLLSVPLMFAAVAIARGSAILAGLEKDPRKVLLMRLLGVTTAGLAFALALAHPPIPSPVLAGNTLATALIGLALFAALLREFRQPFYLYLSFAALGMAYFGAYDFARPWLDRFPLWAAKELGYHGGLPEPFKALNAIAFNLFLIGLDFWFDRRWRSASLSRHCRNIGLAVAIAASLIVCLEPKAAVIGLSFYAVFFTFAAWWYARPWMVHLACAALVGAVGFGSWLALWPSLAVWSLIAIQTAYAFWIVVRWLEWARVSPEYLRPLARSTLGVGTLAVGIATVATLSPYPITRLLIVAWFAIALLCVLNNRIVAWVWQACVAVAALTVGFVVAVSVPWGQPLWGARIDRLTSLLGLTTLALACLAVLMRRLAERPNQTSSRAQQAGLYVRPLFDVGLALIPITFFMYILFALPLIESLLVPGSDETVERARLPAIAIALAATAAALVVVSRYQYRRVEVAAGALGLGLSAYCATIWLDLASSSTETILIAQAVGLGILALGMAWSRIVLIDKPIEGWSLYRKPLLWAYWLLIPLAALAVWVGWRQHAFVAIALGLLAFSLIMSVGIEPGRWFGSLASYFAIAAVLGIWIALTQTVVHSWPRSRFEWGFEVALFGLGIMGVRQWLGSGETLRARRFQSTLPKGALLAVLGGAWLAVANLENGPWLAATLACCSLILLWLTRFERLPGGIFPGLFSFYVSAACLSTWLTVLLSSALAYEWLAATTALTAVTFFLSGAIANRFDATRALGVTCFHAALAATAGASGIAVYARILSVEGFAIGVATVLLGAVVLVLITRSMRRPSITYAAIASFVLAAYLTLLGVGEPDPRKAWILGLAAVVQAILFWSLAIGLRKLRDREILEPLYVQPLLTSSVALTLLAVPLAYSSPITMVLVGLSCLLLIKAFPSPYWLYPGLAAWSTAVYYGFLPRLSAPLLPFAAVMGAFLLVAAALAVRHRRNAICRIFRIENLAYDKTIFHTAMAAALVAVGLRIDLTLRGPAAWNAYAGFPSLLGMFAFAMFVSLGKRLWIHVASCLFMFTIVLVIEPLVGSWHGRLLALFGVANLWLGLATLLNRLEPRLRQRLGESIVAVPSIVESWSLGVLIAGAGPLVFVTAFGVFETLGIIGRSPVGGEWLSVALDFLLAGTYLAVLVRRPGTARGGVATVLLILPALAACWLGAPSSPLARIGSLNLALFLPVSAGIVGLAIAILAWTIAVGASPLGRLWFGPNHDDEWLAGEASVAAVFATLLAVGMTLGEVTIATAVTMALATASAFVLCLFQRERVLPYAASVAWVSTTLYSLFVGLDRIGIGWTLARGVFAGFSAVAAAFVLISISGVARRLARHEEPAESADLVRKAISCEHVSMFVALTNGLWIPSCLLLGVVPLDSAAVLMGVLAMIGSAAILAILAGRWLIEWPVYLAQAGLVGAYGLYRFENPKPIATDALVLVLLGYLDFGVAEAMQRLKLRVFARPTLYFALAMPLLPLGLGLWHGKLDDVNMFIVFASASFYAITCARLQSKRLGYASAVLYNAFLWLFWARVGWRIADHPEFFLIPAGLSAILFAEINRRELGSVYVNIIRGVGLILIYGSLALPIMREQSFHAWLAMLIFSLVGIGVGIALRSQTFVWLGLGCFCLDVLYQLGRMGMENTLAKWGIMLTLGIVLVVFVALNEKKRILPRARELMTRVRDWH